MKSTLLYFTSGLLIQFKGIVLLLFLLDPCFFLFTDFRVSTLSWFFCVPCFHSLCLNLFPLFTACPLNAGCCLESSLWGFSLNSSP